MTKSGTHTTISKMQTPQSNRSTNSSQGNPLTINIKEYENGETRVSISPTPQLAPPPPPPGMTTPRPAMPTTPQDGWETTVGLPTSPPYRAPYKWEEAEKKERARQEHNQQSWAACYDNGCQTHFWVKEGSGCFPQDRSQSAPSLSISNRNNKQQRKRHQNDTTWDKCYEDKCFVHVQEKINAGYYPQENGERKSLSRLHQRYYEPEQQRKFDAVRTRQEREGSEKTQPDIGALERQVQELLDEREQFLKNENQYRQKLAEQQTTISRIREEVQGLRRSVAGSGFSLVRLKNELETRRRANMELEHRNHSLRLELRRAGQRLVDLGK